MTRDKGMNVVSGSASMMLQPSNEYVQVYPSNVFYIFSNDTSPAILPPFFLSMPGLSAAPAFSTLLRLVGNVNSSVSNTIKINITATCPPGSRLLFPGGSASFQHVYQMLLSGRNVSCATCDRPLFDSWRFDARDCLTLNFINAPIFVHSGKALLISGISVVTDSGQVAAYATDWTVTIQLLRSASTGFAVNVNAALQRGQAQPTSAVAVYTDTPGSDYFWVVRLFDRESSSGAPVFHVNFARSVTVTDFSPVSVKMAPSTLAHTGHPSITLTGSFPSGVAQFTSFSIFTLPRSQNNSCFFKSKSWNLHPEQSLWLQACSTSPTLKYPSSAVLWFLAIIAALLRTGVFPCFSGMGESPQSRWLIRTARQECTSSQTRLQSARCLLVVSPAHLP